MRDRSAGYCHKGTGAEPWTASNDNGFRPQRRSVTKKILIVTHHDLSTGSGDVARVKKVGNVLSPQWTIEYTHFSGYSPDLGLRQTYLNLPRWCFSTVQA